MIYPRVAGNDKFCVWKVEINEANENLADTLTIAG